MTMKIPAHKTTIMIHCLDTPKPWGIGRSAADGVKEVRRWHVEERGWSDIAYAAVLDYEGVWADGRDTDGDGDVWEETGAGATGWNKNTIHLALFGGKGSSADDPFSKHYTSEQDQALRLKIAEIQRAAGHRLNVIGHNDVAAKACPGFNVKKWYAQKPEMVAPVPAPVSIFATIAAILARIFGGKK